MKAAAKAKASPNRAFIVTSCRPDGTLIVRTPGICGGRPRIPETRVSVQRIAAWYKMGLNAEEIIERMGI
jgi:uncharacterized protein (DUF433 family)